MLAWHHCYHFYEKMQVFSYRQTYNEKVKDTVAYLNQKQIPVQLNLLKKTTSEQRPPLNKDHVSESQNGQF